MTTTTQKAKKTKTDLEIAQNQKPVKSFVITIEWKKSRTWGANPHAYAKVIYENGGFDITKTFKASGCGYCKESTVIADIFNEVLKYKLYELKELENLPYGIGISKDGRYYEGGVGTSCYPRIAEKIGGKFTRIASGESFDVYNYETI